MSFYDLPELKIPKIRFPKFWRKRLFWFLILTIFVSSVFGFLAGLASLNYLDNKIKDYLNKLNIEIPPVQEDIEKEVSYLPFVQQPLTAEKVQSQECLALLQLP